MAQAIFFVNNLKISDKGEVLVPEAQRRCRHGKVIDRVFPTLPAELQRVLAEFAESSPQDDQTPDADSQSVWRNRLER